ncbi:MAG TPA: MFS transporter [Proteobacteria bacterium]|nr:MFS transporter [Pseudomonadota bacterium]
MDERSRKRNIWALGFVSLFNDIASEIIYPLIPAFLTTVLGASAAVLGIIEGAAESLSSILKLVFGRVSDRLRKRKPIFALGYSLAVLVRPLVAFATSWWHVFAVRLADRTGKGVRTAPRDALLADSADEKSRGFAFGLQRAMDHLGAFLGPLVASAAIAVLMKVGLDQTDATRYTFLFAYIPGALALFVVYFVVRELKPGPRPAGEKLPPLWSRELGGRFYYYLFIVMLFTLGNSTDAFLLLRAQKAGLSVALIPLLWTGLHISKVVFSLAGGRFSDRVGAKTAIFLGWLVYAAVYFGFARVHGAWSVVALFIVYGLYYGLTEGPEKAFVAQFAPSDIRGSAYGMYNLAIGIGALPASVIFGYIWKALGYETAFYFGAALALAAAVGLLFVKPPVRGELSG